MHDDEELHPDSNGLDEPPDLPRAVQVGAGLLLGVFTLLCGAGAITLIIAPSEQARVEARIGGFIMVLVTLWLLQNCARLILGKRREAGLMSARSLRVIAYTILVMPLVGFALSDRHPPFTLMFVFQLIAYSSVVFGVWRLAQARGDAEALHKLRLEREAPRRDGVRE
jgi:hypothetical protein